MVVHAMRALKEEKINKVSLIAFTKNDIGNAFWNTIGWTKRPDVNYYEFVLNEENIIEKINYFLEKGYSREETRLITVKVPTVFSYSRISLDEKIGILQDANLESELLNRPSYLIQGVNLSYARLRFMLDKKLTINHKAFNYLVLDNKNFLKKFGISNDEIRERYPYKK